MRSHLFLASTLVSLLVACGGKGSTPPADPAGGGDTGGEQPAADMKFEDMDHEQRKTFMKDVVLPTMKPMFVAWEAKFESMDCATCHGEGAVDGSFEMPNPGLPVLPATQEGWAALGAEHPDGMTFMAEQVKPTMAKLLGETEFDPATNTGEFGCHGCHTMEGGAR